MLPTAKTGPKRGSPIPCQAMSQWESISMSQEASPHPSGESPLLADQQGMREIQLVTGIAQKAIL